MLACNALTGPSAECVFIAYIPDRFTPIVTCTDVGGRKYCTVVKCNIWSHDTNGRGNTYAMGDTIISNYSKGNLSKFSLKVIRSSAMQPQVSSFLSSEVLPFFFPLPLSSELLSGWLCCSSVSSTFAGFTYTVA